MYVQTVILAVNWESRREFAGCRGVLLKEENHGEGDLALGVHVSQLFVMCRWWVAPVGEGRVS